jgi:VanZ family protein
VILTATSLPGDALRAAPTFPGADKVVHVFMYGVLGWLAASAGATSRRPVPVVALWFGIALFAAADEWHQRWIPGRSADWADWVADALGAAAAIWLLNMASGRRERVA